MRAGPRPSSPSDQDEDVLSAMSRRHPGLPTPSECTYALMCTQVKFDTSKRLARALDSGYLDMSFFLRIVRL